MGLVCSICGIEAVYIVDMDCGRFNHRFYYCEDHKPESFKLKPLGFHQADTEEPIREEKLEIV